MQPRYKIASPLAGEELTRKDLERVVDQANRALMDLYGAILPQTAGIPTVEVTNLGDSITNLITNTITSGYIGSVTDRLRTSGGSTVVLTDDGTNQTLTGSLGELRINAAGILRLLDNVTAAGTLTVTGNTAVGGNLAATGTAIVSGNITGYGRMTISSGVYGDHMIDPDASVVTSSRVLGTTYQNTASTMILAQISVRMT